MKSFLYFVHTILPTTLFNNLFTSFTEGTLPLGHPNDWQLGFQLPGSPIARGIFSFLDDLMVFLTLILFFVIYVMLVCLYILSWNKRFLKLIKTVYIEKNKILYCIILSFYTIFLYCATMHIIYILNLLEILFYLMFFFIIILIIFSVVFKSTEDTWDLWNWYLDKVYVFPNKKIILSYACIFACLQFTPYSIENLCSSTLDLFLPVVNYTWNVLQNLGLCGSITIPSTIQGVPATLPPVNIQTLVGLWIPYEKTVPVATQETRPVTLGFYFYPERRNMDLIFNIKGVGGSAPLSRELWEGLFRLSHEVNGRGSGFATALELNNTSDFVPPRCYYGWQRFMLSNIYGDSLNGGPIKSRVHRINAYERLLNDNPIFSQHLDNKLLSRHSNQVAIPNRVVGNLVIKLEQYLQQDLEDLKEESKSFLKELFVEKALKEDINSLKLFLEKLKANDTIDYYHPTPNYRDEVEKLNFKK